MSKASVVIGSSYGDEGKGLMTDYLCRKYKADMVVRFNGGAQAGHTVVTPEGQRHIFSHIGSGYFAGVPTYLSEFFVLNPILFKKEFQELNVSSDYKIYVNPKCEITTPWDMLANQIKETLRGDSKHGSCGVGFGETLQRVEKYAYTVLNSKDFDSRHDFDYHNIRKYWENYFEGQSIPEWAIGVFKNYGEINVKFYDDLAFMLNHITIGVPEFTYAIFEGAQGLALDQFMGNFPYVTRSNTGMRNVIDLQRKMKFELDEIVYVSRTYETRHGADPDFGGSFEPLLNCYDKTNAPNDFQGTLRYKELDYLGLFKRILTDVNSNNIDRYKINVKVAFTHDDQIKVKKDFFEDWSWSFNYNYLVSGETHLDVKETI